MTDRPEFSDEIQKLADLVMPNLPGDDWEKACIVFEDYEHGSFGIDSHCLADGKNVPVEFSDEEIDSMAELFFVIRQKCIDKWKIAKVEFIREGKFKISFEY